MFHRRQPLQYSAAKRSSPGSPYPPLFYQRAADFSAHSTSPKRKTGNPMARFPALLVSWRPQQGSNLQRALRRGLLYPFNYEDLTHIILPQVPISFQDRNRNKSRKVLSFSAKYRCRPAGKFRPPYQFPVRFN